MSEQYQDFLKKFLVNTDNTGRFIVTSIRTKRQYFVEAIGTPHTNFGDINPATKKIEGSYGEKYLGSITEEQSLITKENGFEVIHTLDPGTSPLAYIEKIDGEIIL